MEPDASTTETPQAPSPEEVAEAQAKLDALHQQASDAEQAAANKPPDINDHHHRLAQLEERVFGYSRENEPTPGADDETGDTGAEN